MARRTNKKTYEQGDRVNIYLSKGVSPEFIKWMNQQTDLSTFFLYAAAKLHEEVGSINVADIAPRRINIDTSGEETAEEPTTAENSEELDPKQNEESPDNEGPDEKEEKEPEAWEGTEDLGDSDYI